LDQAGDDVIARRTQARTIVPDSQLSATLLASDEALDILCQKSSVRLGGNRTKQASADNIVNSLSVLRKAVADLPDPDEKKGILDIIKFDFNRLA